VCVCLLTARDLGRKVQLAAVQLGLQVGWWRWGLAVGVRVGGVMVVGGRVGCVWRLDRRSYCVLNAVTAEHNYDTTESHLVQRRGAAACARARLRWP